MIFVCLGTKRFPFDRLLKQIDLLIEEGKIKEEVFAQIGNTSYLPLNFEYAKFLSPEEYTKKVIESDIVITHGGTGAIVKALKAEKQILAVPRRVKYGEHSDDHQLQIVDFFSKQGYIRRVDDMSDLYSALVDTYNHPITKKFVGTGRVIQIIDDFILQTQ